MKRGFLCIALLSVLLTGCIFEGGMSSVTAIEFRNDRTLILEFPVFGNSGGERVRDFSITPDAEYKIVKQVFAWTQLEVTFNKDIPDGATIEFEIYDSSSDPDGNNTKAYTLVKGEPWEGRWQ